MLSIRNVLLLATSAPCSQWSLVRLPPLPLLQLLLLLHLQVYCEAPAKDGKPRGYARSVISCLDPRTPAQVMHSTHSSDSPPHTISCEQYLFHSKGVRLQLPSCPCIVVELSKEAEKRYCEAAQQSSSSTLGPNDEALYRTYPLEFCWWV
jgi:hypothetical protein